MTTRTSGISLFAVVCLGVFVVVVQCFLCLRSLVTCHLSPGPYSGPVTCKSERITAMIESFRGRDLDAHYLGYFELFNRQQFFEAHDVLEHIWLKDRHGPNGAFYKGLIQLAGAFVHLQKNRLRPAAALFKLALANLEKYPARHEQMDVTGVCRLIRKWLRDLEAAHFASNPLRAETVPALALDLPHPRRP